jgi:hypothetical protein
MLFVEAARLQRGLEAGFYVSTRLDNEWVQFQKNAPGDTCPCNATQSHSPIGCAWCSTLALAISYFLVSAFKEGLGHTSLTMNTVIFDIVMFLVFCMNSIDFLDPVYLQPVNAYVAIFGVVFETSTSLPARYGISGTDTDASVCSLELRSFTCCESNIWV